MRPRCAELIELTDGVVHLRSPDARGIEAIAALCQDPAIQEFTTVPSPDGRAEGEAFVEQVVPAGWASRTSLTWGVRDASSDLLDGVIDLACDPERRGLDRLSSTG